MDYTHHKIHHSRKEYREIYLQSEEWKAKSRAILIRDKICKVCEENKSNQVHHLTYLRLGNELDTDLVAICAVCHNRIHTYHELASISDLKYLKHVFFKSKYPCEIQKNLVDKILKSDINIKKAISSILKVPESDFPTLAGKEIHYFILRKIFKALKKPVYENPRQGRFSEVGLIRMQMKLRKKINARGITEEKRQEYIDKLKWVNDALNCK